MHYTSVHVITPVIMKDHNKLFCCEVCQKYFKRKSHLQKHKNVCNSEKINQVRKFNCSTCGDKFLLKHHATTHMKIGINNKSEYFCKSCDEIVLVNEKLEHEKKQHNNFFCDFCNYIGHINNRKRHLKAKHAGMTPFPNIDSKGYEKIYM